MKSVRLWIVGCFTFRFWHKYIRLIVMFCIGSFVLLIPFFRLFLPLRHIEAFLFYFHP